MVVIILLVKPHLCIKHLYLCFLLAAHTSGKMLRKPEALPTGGTLREVWEPGSNWLQRASVVPCVLPAEMRGAGGLTSQRVCFAFEIDNFEKKKERKI